MKIFTVVLAFLFFLPNQVLADYECLHPDTSRQEREFETAESVSVKLIVSVITTFDLLDRLINSTDTTKFDKDLCKLHSELKKQGSEMEDYSVTSDDLNRWRQNIKNK